MKLIKDFTSGDYQKALLAKTVSHILVADMRTHLATELQLLGISTVQLAPYELVSAHITLRLNRHVIPRPQMFRLSVEDKGVNVIASDVRGLHYGVTSFIQLVRIMWRSQLSTGMRWVVE